MCNSNRNRNPSRTCNSIILSSMTKSSVLWSVANCMKDILPIQTLDGQQTPPGICEPQMSVSRYLEVILFQDSMLKKYCNILQLF